MKVLEIAEELAGNSYPGRGVVLGCSADGKSAVAAYFIMGRSENSRNRIFAQTEDGIRTEAFDPSKMVDPSLIIYHPVRLWDGRLIVTNGDQTDTVWEGMKQGKPPEAALRTREFEPDGPNYTPRISGVLEADGSYQLSILKSADGDPASSHRFFYEYDKPTAGVGHFIHTYMGDGDPLPSFEGEPKPVRIEGDAEAFADRLWTNLNAENKVSLYVCFRELASGKQSVVIRNKNA